MLADGVGGNGRASCFAALSFRSDISFSSERPEPDRVRRCSLPQLWEAGVPIQKFAALKRGRGRETSHSFSVACLIPLVSSQARRTLCHAERPAKPGRGEGRFVHTIAGRDYSRFLR